MQEDEEIHGEEEKKKKKKRSWTHRSLQIVNFTHGDWELHRRSTIGMCLMETRFVCAMGLLLCYGSFSSLRIFFFFLSFCWVCSVYFEIECKRLEIYVAKTCPNQHVGSEFLKLEFYMELEFLKLEMLICKSLSYLC